MLTSAEHPSKLVHPGLTTTVPREYVHRTALAEVFLTDWKATAPDRFTVSAQWPRRHSFYTTGRRLYDPLLLCETIRQTFPLLVHAAYQVPFGHQLSWSHFSFTANPEAMRIGDAPAELELQVTCSDIRRVRGLPAEMSMHFAVVRDEMLLAVADTRFGCHTPAVYRRMRAERSNTLGVFRSAPIPPEPLPAGAVGRGRQEDVVLSGVDVTPQSPAWRLRIDTGHPVLFDHPVDHVPGMLLLEAVRQAVHALHPMDDMLMPIAMDIAFHRYVEFDTPCTLTVESDDSRPSPLPRTIALHGLQNGDRVFSATTEARRVD
ncbi:ScbA/BarX family gamma-butyrolactone biosynthesis protein [Streptomyces tritici]|uniref:ScbA/BarX family gamma-butyrolactone biosynthesis protein n=1 Tax=Streptomyces tritici TaxID=2054410 RepID=UPI003AEF20D8